MGTRVSVHQCTSTKLRHQHQPTHQPNPLTIQDTAPPQPVMKQLQFMKPHHLLTNPHLPAMNPHLPAMNRHLRATNPHPLLTKKNQQLTMLAATLSNRPTNPLLLLTMLPQLLMSQHQLLTSQHHRQVTTLAPASAYLLQLHPAMLLRTTNGLP